MCLKGRVDWLSRYGKMDENTHSGQFLVMCTGTL